MRNTTLFTIISGLLLAIIITNSCKKDDELDIPIVSFISPSENSYFTVGDTVDISVKVESVSDINKIDFNIYSKNNHLIRTKKSIIRHNETANTYQMSMIITDKYLDGGDYKIICSAQNKKELKKKEQSIIISGQDKELIEIAVVTSDHSKTTIYSLGTDFNTTPTTKFTIKEANAFTDFSAFYNRISMAGSVDIDANVFEYYNKDSVYKVKNINNSQFPYFTGFQNINNNMALMYYNGKVEIHNYTGRINTTFYSNYNYYSSKIMTFDNDIVVLEKRKNSSNEQLVFRNASTYSQYAIHVLGNNFINLFPFESGEAMIFFNDNNSGNIQKYIKKQNGFYVPINYNGGKINHVAQIDKNNYLFASDNALKWYQYHISSITNIIDNVNIAALEYDPTSNIIYLSSGNSIMKYSFPNGQLIDSYEFTETIINFHLIYNIP